MDPGEFVEIIITLVIGVIVIIGVLGGSVPSEIVTFGKNIIVITVVAALAFGFVSQIID